MRQPEIHFNSSLMVLGPQAPRESPQAPHSTFLLAAPFPPAMHTASVVRVMRVLGTLWKLLLLVLYLKHATMDGSAPAPAPVPPVPAVDP